MQRKKTDWLLQYDKDGRVIRKNFESLIDKAKTLNFKNVDKHIRSNINTCIFPTTSDDDIVFLEIKNLIKKALKNQLCLDDETKISIVQLTNLLNCCNLKIEDFDCTK